MLRRCQFLLVSLAVCVVSVLPSFAWSFDSFVGEELIEDISSPVSSPSVEPQISFMTSALSDSPSLFSVEGTEFFRLFSPLQSRISVICTVTHPPISGGGVTIPEFTGPVPYPTDGFPLNFVESNANTFHFRSDYFSVPDTINGADVISYDGFVFDPQYLDSGGSDLSLRTALDLSSFGDFTSFELNGSFCCYFRCNKSASSLSAFYDAPVDSVGLYVNGALVRTFYSSFCPSYNNYYIIDFADFVYSSSVPIHSIEFSFTPMEESVPYTPDLRCYVTLWQNYNYDVFPSFTVLSDKLGKPDGMDSADSALNDYQNQEGKYFSDANDALNSLNTSLSASFLSAAEMIGGLFNDIWSVLGDVKLLYFTPLMFGFFLWVIGVVRKR